MIGQRPISPAITALENILRQTIPFLSGTYPFSDRERGRRGSAPRLQPNAGPKKQTSHLAGLALDIFLASQGPIQRMLAHYLISVFIGHQAQMQWSQIIYERSNFIRRGNSVNHHPYHADSDHFSHIHIDWWQANAVRGEEVRIPTRAMRNDFAHSMRRDLEELNRDWSSNSLEPFDLSVSVRGIGAFRSVGR